MNQLPELCIVLWLVLRILTLPYMDITSTNKAGRNDHLIILVDKETDWKKLQQPEENIDIIRSQLKKDVKQIIIPSPTRMVFAAVLEEKPSKYQTDEAIRKAGNKILSAINQHKLAAI